ncbi:MAG: hypothetical protein FWF80_03015 [Defluviitaleaceae bacterium]|nr:hypothetical protein [Defluviitaleaceae bacterium]
MGKNEKMRVLDLLESGKINAAEAAQLLSVLNGPSKPLITKESRENAEERMRQFAKECSKFAKECGHKMQDMYTDAKPKIKKASQVALEKAADALDNLATSINESLDDPDEEDPPATPKASPKTSSKTTGKAKK